MKRNKLREKSGKALLQRTLRSSINCFPNKWRLWFNQRELTLIFETFVTNLYSFKGQWIHFCNRSEDFFRLDSTFVWKWNFFTFINVWFNYHTILKIMFLTKSVKWDMSNFSEFHHMNMLVTFYSIKVGILWTL